MPENIGKFECSNCGHTWEGTRDLESEEYTELCPDCNSSNIDEVGDIDTYGDIRYK